MSEQGRHRANGRSEIPDPHRDPHQRESDRYHGRGPADAAAYQRAHRFSSAGDGFSKHHWSPQERGRYMRDDEYRYPPHRRADVDRPDRSGTGNVYRMPSPPENTDRSRHGGPDWMHDNLSRAPVHYQGRFGPDRIPTHDLPQPSHIPMLDGVDRLPHPDDFDEADFAPNHSYVSRRFDFGFVPSPLDSMLIREPGPNLTRQENRPHMPIHAPIHGGNQFVHYPDFVPMHEGFAQLPRAHHSPVHDGTELVPHLDGPPMHHGGRQPDHMALPLVPPAHRLFFGDSAGCAPLPPHAPENGRIEDPRPFPGVPYQLIPGLWSGALHPPSQSTSRKRRNWTEGASKVELERLVRRSDCEKSGGVIVVRRVKVEYEALIIKRFGKWELPKGKLEKDNGELIETYEQAAVRELEEESGLKMKPHMKLGDLVSEDTYEKKDKSKKRIGKIVKYFLLYISDEEVEFGERESRTELVDWVGSQGLQTRAWSRNLMRSFVQKALNQAKMLDDQSPSHDAEVGDKRTVQDTSVQGIKFSRIETETQHTESRSKAAQTAVDTETKE